jgi:tRNA/tmRNA/rRNA uracil-C5-methylase (TrmA/RlmC/RlmD family)
VRVIGGDELRAGRRAFIHEEVAGRGFRISARSFFQPQPDGAEALIAAAVGYLGETPLAQGRLVDLYGGVGLFAATVGSGWRVTLVESSASAIAEARVNFAGSAARVICSGVARWRSSPADAVIADPPRAGSAARASGPSPARAPTAWSWSAVTLVSWAATPACSTKPATPVGVAVVDQFVGTPHVEVVSYFKR